MRQQRVRTSIVYWFEQPHFVRSADHLLVFDSLSPFRTCLDPSLGLAIEPVSLLLTGVSGSSNHCCEVLAASMSPVQGGQGLGVRPYCNMRHPVPQLILVCLFHGCSVGRLNLGE